MRAVIKTHPSVYVFLTQTQAYVEGEPRNA